tara:strand:- start:439 stop:888 length:450 start_codon:yes stop_codon:yes gene_type:complete
MKLNLKQQRALIKALPAHRINDVKKHCKSCQMKGQGIGAILKSIGSVLGPIAKEVGPTVLKELVLPFVKYKLTGSGTHLAGKGTKLAGGSMPVAGRGTKLAGGSMPVAGRGLRLAGQRGPRGKGKKSMKAYTIPNSMITGSGFNTTGRI